VCVDASLVIASLLPETISDRADLLLDRLRAAGEALIAPALLTAEVSSALRNAVFTKRIPSELGEAALDAFKQYPIRLHEMSGLMHSAWAWAKAVNAPRLYDMYYLALADSEGCDLWTADRRLVGLVGRSFARAKWVGEVTEGNA